MRPDTMAKISIAVSTVALAVNVTAAYWKAVRIADLEEQRDIYKSRSENWECTAKEAAGRADALSADLRKYQKLDGELTVEDAGEFFCTAYCTEKRPHICGTGTGITASGTPVTADLTVAADQSIFPYGTVLFIEDVGIRIVQDKGAGVQGKHLDVAVSGSHEDALNWNGYGEHRVWVIKEKNDG